MPNYDVGHAIDHPVYGLGFITAVETYPDGDLHYYVVTFENDIPDGRVFEMSEWEIDNSTSFSR